MDHTVLPATWQRWLSRLTPAEAGTRFSDPGGIQGWVDLGGGYNSQDSLPAKDSRLSQKKITRQCHDRKANPRPWSREFDVLTTRPPSHQTFKDTLSVDTCFRNTVGDYLLRKEEKLQLCRCCQVQHVKHISSHHLNNTALHFTLHML